MKFKALQPEHLSSTRDSNTAAIQTQILVPSRKFQNSPLLRMDAEKKVFPGRLICAYEVCPRMVI